MSVLGILGAAGSLLGSITQSKNVSDQIKAQSDENAKNRQYNMMLAQYQNQQNLAQWNRENAYNNPSAVRQRLRNAGLNADLIYGNGVGNLAAATSPQMTAGASSNPVDVSAIGSKRTLGDALAQSAAYAQQDAQTELLRAQARKTDADAENVKSQTLLNEDELSNMRPNQRKLLISQAQSLDKSMDVMSADIEQKWAQVANLNIDASFKQWQQHLGSKQFEAQILRLTQDIRESNSRINVNAAQVRRMLELLPYELQGIAADVHLKGKQSVLIQEQSITEILHQMGIQIDVDTKKFTLSQNKDFESIERSIGIAGKIVNIISQALSTITFWRGNN